MQATCQPVSFLTKEKLLHIKKAVYANRVLKGGGGGCDPVFLLLFCESLASYFLFISLSHIPCPILMNPAFQEQSIPHFTLILSEILDLENTLPDFVSNFHWIHMRCESQL